MIWFGMGIGFLVGGFTAFCITMWWTKPIFDIAWRSVKVLRGRDIVMEVKIESDDAIKKMRMLQDEIDKLSASANALSQAVADSPIGEGEG